jgi:hypothetical protein
MDSPGCFGFVCELLGRPGSESSGVQWWRWSPDPRRVRLTPHPAPFEPSSGNPYLMVILALEVSAAFGRRTVSMPSL